VCAVDAARRLVELVAIAIVTAREVLDPVLAVIDGDAIQPRRELRFLAELIDRLEHGDEDFLCDVFSLGTIAEHAIRDVVDPVALGLDQLAERLLVAVAETSQERSLELRHSPRA
jgi:hypothetical protein